MSWVRIPLSLQILDFSSAAEHFFNMEGVEVSESSSPTNMAPAYDGGILVLHTSGHGSIPCGATKKGKNKFGNLKNLLYLCDMVLSKASCESNVTDESS